MDDIIFAVYMGAYMGVPMILRNELQTVYGGSFFLHIASELRMLVGSVFALVLCHSYLSTSHKSFPFSTTSWVKLQGLLKIT